MAFILKFAVIIFALLSLPRAAHLPLRSDLIGLDTPRGQAALLRSDAINDYFPLSVYFTTQITAAYCGPASISMVLNALEVPRPADKLTAGLGLWNQKNLFTPRVNAVKPASSILAPPFGMNLAELGAVLRAHYLKPTVVHAGDTHLAEFRRFVIEGLKNRNNFILVNYLRSAMGQQTGGHISPIAAYDSRTDRFLILDVARYKYQPVWVYASSLFGSMDTIDSSIGNNNRTRGYVSVSR